jgi:uncharacterized protein YndB with AHSA1/START domain
VWKALTDHNEFGDWFGVKLEAPFVPGKETRGQITYPGYEHVVMSVVTQKIQPQSFFSFTWHPYAIDPKVDYSGEKPTLVEFRLEPSGNGTLLRVTESGFDALPAHRRAEAFRMNEGGWAEQVNRINRYVTDHR